MNSGVGAMRPERKFLSVEESFEELWDVFNNRYAFFD